MIAQIQSTALISTYGISYEMRQALKEIIAVFKNQVSIDTRLIATQDRESLIEIEIKSYFGQRFERSKEEFDLYLNAILKL